MSYKVKNLILCRIIIIWNSNSIGNSDKIDVMMENIRTTNSFSARQLNIIKDRLTYSFFPQYNKMWKKVSRRRDLFMVKNESFLQSGFEVQFDFNNDDSRNNVVFQQSRNKSRKLSKGRPRLSYDEGSAKTKKRRIEELVFSCSEEELTRALTLKKQQSANEIVTETVDCEEKDDIDNVLAMYVDLQLSKRKYEKLRIHSVSINPGNPTYATIMNAKRSCYPDHIVVSDLGASVHFISLLEHTTKRVLAQLNRDELKKLRDKKLLLIEKWDMDGASG